ncbi:MAG TPA: MFS transporter [Euzebya sp.]|nr:MFS transporter [Euzebya sp.]
MPATDADAIEPSGGRRFTGLLSASVVSGIGDGLVLVALPLLAATITRDPRLIAGVAVAQRLPWVVLSLHGGALVDRLSLRHLLPSIEFVRGAALLILGAMTLSGDMNLQAIYLVAFVIGSGDTIVASGLHAAIPQMVPASALSRANGRIQMSQVSGGEFVGPAIGGALFGLAAALPFFVDGVSYLVSGLLLALVLPSRGASDATPTNSLGREVLDGLRWFFSNEVLRLLALLIGAFAFFQAAVLALLVLLATGPLGLGEGQFGVFLAMGAVGNIVGAGLAERLPGNRVSAIVLSAGGVTAASYMVMGLTTIAPLAGAAFLVEGVAIAAANVVTVSLRQQLIPIPMLGRVGAAFRLCIYGTMPLGALLGGLLAARVGVAMAITTAGVGQLLVVVAIAAPATRLLRDTGDIAEDDRTASWSTPFPEQMRDHKPHSGDAADGIS